MKSVRWWLVVGALCGLLRVTLGAFGAHVIKGQVAPDLLANWVTASDYLGMHGLAILICGLFLLQRPAARLAHFAAWAFLAGSILFSGSLYLMVLSGERLLGAITPVGGIALIVGWVLLAIAAWRATADTV